MAPLYWKPTAAQVYNLGLFRNVKFFQFIFYFGIPCGVFGSTSWTGANKNSREGIFMIIDDRYGYEKFAKMSSHKQGLLMQDAACEALIARNATELHLP